MATAQLFLRFAGIKEALASRMPELGKMLVNFSWLSFERFLGMLISLLVGIWVARYLGPEKYGILSYSLAVIGIVAALPRFGFDEILVRELLDKPAETGALIGTTLITRLASAGMACIAVALYAQNYSDERMRYYALLIFSFLLFRDVFATLEAWFKAEIAEKHLVWSRAAGSLTATALRVALILLQADFVYFCLTYLIDWLIYGSMLGYQFRMAAKSRFRLSFEPSRILSLLKLSWPLYLSSIAVVIYMKFDQVVLQYLIGSVSVGHYAAAVRICEIFHFVPAAIASSIFPVMIRSVNDGRPFFLPKYLCFMAIVAYSLSLPLSLLSVPLVSLFYGKEFADTAAVLAIYSFNFLPIFLGTARNQYLLSIGKTHISLLCTVLGMISNVALCFLLIPRFGTIGAAAAAFTALMVSDFFSSFLFADLRQVGFGQLRALLLVDTWKFAKEFLSGSRRQA